LRHPWLRSLHEQLAREAFTDPWAEVAALIDLFLGGPLQGQQQDVIIFMSLLMVSQCFTMFHIALRNSLCKFQNHNLKHLVIMEFVKGKNISLREGACWQLLDLEPNLRKKNTCVLFSAWIWIAGAHSARNCACQFLSKSGGWLGNPELNGGLKGMINYK
jgi:hypothetical protein